MKKEKNKARNKILGTQEGFLPLLPLNNMVMLPKSIISVIVGRDISIKAVEHALKHDRMLFVSTQRDIAVENPTTDDIFIDGTIATILQVMRMSNGSLKILVES